MDGRYMMHISSGYSKTLLHHCLDHRGTPFIYASSAAVYGGATEFVEDPIFEKPLNVYGYSKLQFDRYVRRVALGGSSPVVGLSLLQCLWPARTAQGRHGERHFSF